MKTDDLVAMLATGTGAMDAGTVRRRFAAALACGATGAIFFLAVFLGINQSIAQIAQAPMFWTKLAYCAALAAAALALTAQLARPGARAMPWAAALAVPLLGMWLLAVLAIAGTSGSEREALVYGATWRYCAFNIALLALPLFAALLWAVKGLAPTRLALAGAAAGLLSGAAAALIYSLHCPELGAPFLGIWYPLGMLIPAAAGALAGPRLLRW
jgi:hypothetical protein